VDTPSAYADTVAPDTVDRPSAPPQSWLPRGAAIGRYVVLDRLGGGGMGLVYAAYDPHLDRRVALKLLRADQRAGGGGMSEGRTRLLREAQAMARLSHPNVIAVHDVGTIDDEVFIAMEYVEGDTLAAWRDAEPRTTEAILEAFLQAARGLSAAHAKGLVHRDFKPDNVLVGNDGRVRVLDFGLARAESAPALSSIPPSATSSGEVPVLSSAGASIPPPPPSSKALDTPLTRVGAIMGTPRYMAPEQFAGTAVDARTDVFAFCVSLYEALYDQHPFGGDDEQQLIRRVQRAKVRPEPAAKKLPAPLRAALLRGMAREPAERFPSIDALVDAIAPPPSRARRAWAWPAAAGAALLATAAGLLWVRAARPQPGAECETSPAMLAGAWDDTRRADVERAFLATGTPYAKDAVRGATSALDGYARAWSAMRTDACLATRVRHEQSDELLDLRMQCLGERRSELAALSSVFASADAKTVEHAVSAAASLTDVASCGNVAALRAPAPPPKDAPTRAAIDAVRATIAEARAEEGAGRYAEEVERAQQADAAAAGIAYAPLAAEAKLALGEARYYMHDYASARATLGDAAAAALGARADDVAARAFTSLVGVESFGGDPRGALESGALASAAIARVGDEPRLSFRLEMRLQLADRHEGRYDEARAHLEKAAGLADGAFAASPLERADIDGAFGSLADEQGHYEESLSWHRRALELRTGALGDGHPLIADTLSNIGWELEMLGRFDEALVSAERALSLVEAAFGAESERAAGMMHTLGDVEDDLGRFDAAAAHMERALAIFERVHGEKNEEVANTLNDLGVVRNHAHQNAGALDAFRRALSIYEELHGGDHPRVALALDNVGNTLRMLGKSDEARRYHEQALAVGRKAYGADDHPEVASILANLGLDFASLGQAAQARDALERSVAMWDRLGDREPDSADARFALAKVLGAGSAADRARAAALAKDARETDASHGGRALASLPEIDAWLAKHEKAAP
jgi:tetratricopeptide (TPR) repeat protein/predicted Ser/Thr protein kinase